MGNQPMLDKPLYLGLEKAQLIDHWVAPHA
jgi:hypothetical protein